MTKKARQAAGELHVPLDCKTLDKAFKKARKNRTIKTIVVGKGEHRVKKDQHGNNFLVVDFPITIRGSGDKTEVVVLGGFMILEDIQGKVHLHNMTIRHLEGCGVMGKSSFALEDVTVDQCMGGVCAGGTSCVAECTNVEVHQCTGSGVAAVEGGSITMIGVKTTVHHNNTSEASNEFGLAVGGLTSTIQLIHPLTKEIVATDNQGGGNWGVPFGDINQIHTIPTSTEETKSSTCRTK